MAARDDAALGPLCEGKGRAGKHHFGSVGAVANKLTDTICPVRRDNKPYVPVPRQSASCLRMADLDRPLGPGNKGTCPILVCTSYRGPDLSFSSL